MTSNKSKQTGPATLKARMT